MSVSNPINEGGLVALSDLGLIAADGEQARAFLHTQLTQDIESLDPGQARLAGYCSPKGRLLASFIAWSPQPDLVLLACSADLLAPTLKRLSMFVLRMKCKLSDAAPRWRLHGLLGAAGAAWLGSDAPSTAWQRVHKHGAEVIRLPDAAGTPRWLLAWPAEQSLPDLPAVDLQRWHQLEVRSALPRITAATVEQFVPQMINFEAVGGVSFSKGCYPGQEIVARSQYRGTIKRRALRFEVNAPARAGEPIYAATDPEQPAGQIVLAAGGSVLAEVKLAAAESGEALHLGAPGGPVLASAALPYTLPTPE